MDVVTGATGRIGNVLVKELVARGRKVRVFTRINSNLDVLQGVNVEIVYGDILDYPSLVNAFINAENVYHLAGEINISNKHKNKTFETNIEGTRNVVRACLDTGIKRLIYTSSIHAFEAPKTGIIDETTPLCDENCSRGVYDQSKAKATQVVLEGVKNGLDAVIVCPTGVIGPYDYRPSFFGQGMIEAVKSGLRTTVEGEYDYVDVRDVVNGILLAAEKGRKGEKYILGGSKLNMHTYTEILKQLASIKTKTNFLSLKTALFIGHILNFFNKRSAITPYSISTLHSNANVSHNKAAKELGYTARPLEESIKDQYDWFIQNKYI